jgi:TetR/AcrR family transcriptional repressor of nem operon
MRKNKSDTAESRRQILQQAARLFRERGPERVSVADVMEAAGMTHGGFYKHFESKEALFAATLAAAFSERLDHLDALTTPDKAEGLRGYLDHYLTLGHVENPAIGCPIAGLTADAVRASPESRAALSEGATTMLDRFAVAAGSDEAAIEALTSAIGAVVLARAVQDEALRRQILKVAAGMGRAVREPPR